MRFLVILLLPFLQAVPQPVREPLASIEGVVLVATSGDPLARAEVTLTRQNLPAPAGQAGPATTPVLIPPVSTERDGKFVFRDLLPGQYFLRVKRNGFAPQEYGQQSPTAPGASFALVSGQQMKGVVFKLVAGAIVAGRVRDAVGEPMPSLTVSLLRVQYLPTGQRSYFAVGSATTDDRGEYRVFWVPAGRYFVSLSAANLRSNAIRDQYVFLDRVFPLMYYPGTVDATRANSLDLRSGETLSGIDFIVTPSALRTVRGKVTSAVTGRPVSNAQVSASPRRDLPSDSLENRTAFSLSDGTFEIRNVMPGTYWLHSQANDSQPLNPAAVSAARTSSDLIGVALSNRVSAQIPLDVGDSDIEGMTLVLKPAPSVTLRLTGDGEALSALPGYERIQIQLRSTASSASSGAGIFNPLRPFSAEGTTVVTGVPAGEYRIFQITPTPPLDLYIKSVMFDRDDVLSRPFSIADSNEVTLNLVISSKAGQVSGTLLNATSNPVRNHQVVLIPDQGREKADLFKTARTDQDGRFMIRGVVPGGYKLFAWESLESNAFYDRDVLAAYEGQGRAVRIQESSKETADIRIIPAPR